MKKYVKILKQDNIICESCEMANTHFTRFMGLMFRKGLEENCGLILDPCNQIHTFHMRFPIDVVTIDKDNIILDIFEAVEPWKVKPVVKNGKKVIELDAFVAKEKGLKIGDKLTII